MPGRSLALVAMSTDSGHNFSTSSRGPQMDLFCPMKDFLAEKKSKKSCLLAVILTLDLDHSKCKLVLLQKSQPRLCVTFQSMFEAVLQDDKELLQGRVLRVQRPAQTQGGLD